MGRQGKFEKPHFITDGLKSAIETVGGTALFLVESKLEDSYQKGVHSVIGRIHELETGEASESDTTYASVDDVETTGVKVVELREWSNYGSCVMTLISTHGHESHEQGLSAKQITFDGKGKEGNPRSFTGNRQTDSLRLSEIKKAIQVVERLQQAS